MKTIRVEIKNQYGNELVYPACDTSRLFVELTGCKTFSPYHLDRIKQLGYLIETVAPLLPGESS